MHRIHPFAAPLALSAALLGGLLAGDSFATDQVPANAPAAAPAGTPVVEEARALIQEFAGTLQGELKAAMTAGGPPRAVAVCKERAPAIAADLSARSGWDLGRTSLKLRHPELNAPDAWEQAVLERFEARKAAGEPVDTLSFAEVVADGEGKRFRFMKAIPTATPCLACHGTQIAPETAAALDESYPKDQARGFSEGDIRGAFTLSKPF